MTTRARLLRWAFLFLVVLYVHFRGIATLYDSLWTIPTTLSIIHQGNIDLDEYASVIREGDYRVTTLNGHLYPTFPIGGSVIAVPFVLVIDKVWGLSGLDLYEQLQQYSFEDRPQEWMITEVFIASFIVAVTSVLLYILAGWYLKRGHALLVAGVFAFCTSAWSTASRALWQHGPSMLMLTMTLCLFVAAKKRPWLIQLAGVPLAFSFVVRPTNAISVLLLTVLVFVEHRPYFVRFVLWATLIVAVPFLLFNVSLYASVLPPYYREDTPRYGHSIGCESRLLWNPGSESDQPIEGLVRVFADTAVLHLWYDLEMAPWGDGETRLLPPGHHIPALDRDFLVFHMVGGLVLWSSLLC
jgi:hypothetical protein